MNHDGCLPKSSQKIAKSPGSSPRAQGNKSLVQNSSADTEKESKQILTTMRRTCIGIENSGEQDRKKIKKSEQATRSQHKRWQEAAGDAGGMETPPAAAW